MIGYIILMRQNARHRQYNDNDSGLLVCQAHVLFPRKVKFSSPLRPAVVTTRGLNDAKGDSFPALKRRVCQNVYSFLFNAYIHGAMSLFPHTPSWFGTNLSTGTIFYTVY
jgi:hypothetical protein